jgi:hypothetical protein
MIGFIHLFFLFTLVKSLSSSFILTSPTMIVPITFQRHGSTVTSTRIRGTLTTIKLSSTHPQQRQHICSSGLIHKLSSKCDRSFAVLAYHHHHFMPFIQQKQQQQPQRNITRRTNSSISSTNNNDHHDTNIRIDTDQQRITTTTTTAATTTNTIIRRQSKAEATTTTNQSLDFEKAFEYSSTPRSDARFQQRSDDEGDDDVSSFNKTTDKSIDYNLHEPCHDDITMVGLNDDEVMIERVHDQRQLNELKSVHKSFEQLPMDIIQRSIALLRPYVQVQRYDKITSIVKQRTKHTRFLFESKS